MTVITNYAELSSAMRAALIERETTRYGTAQALVRRNLVHNGLTSRNGAWPLALTGAGQRARAALLEPEKAVPAKVQPWLDKAVKLGLETKEDEPGVVVRCWTISSPNPIDESQVWVYWVPGPRGGRVSFTVWYGVSMQRRKATRRLASAAITEMGESLRRHEAREFARETKEQKAELAAALVAEELGLTAEQFEERTDVRRLGWFMVGQFILRMHADPPVSHQVLITELGADGRLARVAVATNGGFTGMQWYGDPITDRADVRYARPITGTLEDLERAAGLRDEDRRPFPGLAAALEGVQRTLADQRLSGWAAGLVEPKRIVVNLPNGTDPTRHLVLLRRYVPYRATVTLLDRSHPTRWPVVVIKPLEES